MQKYFIIIKIKTTKKEKTIKKEINKKLKSIDNIKYKLKIIKKEKENQYLIKISLVDLSYLINLKDLIISIVANFEKYRVKLEKINN